ncbi:MAG: thioredoxin family protein [Gemmatimonadaceae bacterium]|nr:thioredoxin family protein [Gemmatimonadaceae bacterium]
MEMTADRFAAAPDFPAFLSQIRENVEMWPAVHRTARIPEELVARGREIPGQWKLVALVEDWCGDAVNVIPVLARLVEQLPNFELKLLERDENPDLMDAHLTDGTARAIPIVIVYDSAFREVGWWGPRPAELQRWFKTEGQSLEKGERYKQARTWYARDRGRSTLEEVLEIAEAASNGVRIPSVMH